MPKEIFEIEKFIALSKEAEQCLIKKKSNYTKLKLRKNKVLYTIKINKTDLEDTLKKIKCETIEK